MEEVSGGGAELEGRQAGTSACSVMLWLISIGKYFMACFWGILKGSL